MRHTKEHFYVNRLIFIPIFLITVLVGFSTYARTPQELGKWEVGELLIENYSFEDGLAAWELEDGACCDRGGLYTMEIDKDNPQHGNQSLKIVGHIATGTGWHAKIKQKDVSMRADKKYTIIFWARSEKARPAQFNVQIQQDPWDFLQGGDFTIKGPEWEEYSLTFTASQTVNRLMWVSLAIAQSDIDFWIDNFRFFEGEVDDELGREDTFPVDAKEKLTTQWASVKTDRF